jgi:Trypsin
LLQLEDHVCIDGPPLTLNEDSDLPSLGAELTVLGLGYYVHDDFYQPGISPPQLMDTTNNILDGETCSVLIEDISVDLNITFPVVDGETMFCAIYVNDDSITIGGQSSCFGDSGGPVVYIEEDGSHTFMGPVSWGGIPCGGALSPDVNARVSFAMEWIKMMVRDEWGEEAYFCPGGVSSCNDDVGGSSEDDEPEDKKEEEEEEEDKEDKDD